MVRCWVLISLFVLAVLTFAGTRAEAVDELEPMLSGKTRLMVISPHPDDESLGAGGLIQRVLSKGGRVRVVFMTCGDGFSEGLEKEKHLLHPGAADFRKYGRERMKESVKALSVLGLEKKDVIFLGFPDAVLSNLISKAPAAPSAYLSPFTLENHPLSRLMLIPHTDYNGRDLIREVTWELAHFRPNVVATTPCGQHPDHCATHYFVIKALWEMERKDPSLRPQVLNFLIHFRHYPMDTVAGACLNPPKGFLDKAEAMEEKWMSLSLSPRETATKRKAIRQYHTQMLIMDSYLMSFVRPNELFILDRQELEKEAAEVPWCAKGVL